MLKFAVKASQKRGLNFIQLDCPGDREKVCKIYEDFGFKKLAHFDLAGYDTAFYECKIN